MSLLSMILAAIFERRAFCQYLCPIGGFSGLYARLSPVEVRVKDFDICATHTQKTCYSGSESGYGCPWGNFPAALRENTNCGMCMECLRSCPHDNLALNIRSLGKEASTPTSARMDETWLGIVMLASALVYSALFLGPWGWLKMAAYAIGSLPWLGYAAGFLGFTLVILPALFAFAVMIGKNLSRSSLSIKGGFGLFSQALLPLGLATWVAFTVAFAFAKLSYILPVLNDPFGWGWTLLGILPAAGTPFLPGLVPIFQALLVAGGLLWSARLVTQYAHQVVPSAVYKMALPVIVFCLAYSASLLGLLML